MIDKISGRILATCFSPGKTTDFRLIQASQLALPDTTTCYADAGYQGLPRLFKGAKTPHKKPNKKSKVKTLTREQKTENKEQRRERVCVEHTMRRLKVFKILSYKYRNHRTRFGLRFNLIAALLNYDLPKPKLPKMATDL